jgi:hypothetical protein
VIRLLPHNEVDLQNFAVMVDGVRTTAKLPRSSSLNQLHHFC